MIVLGMGTQQPVLMAFATIDRAIDIAIDSNQLGATKIRIQRSLSETLQNGRWVAIQPF